MCSASKRRARSGSSAPTATSGSPPRGASSCHRALHRRATDGRAVARAASLLVARAQRWREAAAATADPWANDRHRCRQRCHRRCARDVVAHRVLIGAADDPVEPRPNAAGPVWSTTPATKRSAEPIAQPRQVRRGRPVRGARRLDLHADHPLGPDLGQQIDLVPSQLLAKVVEAGRGAPRRRPPRAACAATKVSSITAEQVAVAQHGVLGHPDDAGQRTPARSESRLAVSA